jgi:hypothetical protein
VIEVGPVMEDGSRFPTTLWLTCPWLTRSVSNAESLGLAADWAERIAADPELAGAARATDEAYRRLRASLVDGEDPCAGVGIAGQADALAVKCLHARVAAALCGLGDPVGLGVLAALGGAGVAPDCPDDQCGTARGSGRG